MSGTMSAATIQKTESNLRAYVAGRFAEFFDSLNDEDRSKWYGEEAIYDRARAIESALEEMAAQGIDCKSKVGSFDMEALWE